jgi:DNA-binding NtrC family response regulator
VPAIVLVVDDDPLIAESLRVALGAHEVTIECAGDATNAALMLDEKRYCGLVLDIVLRSGSGFDVLDHMARNGIRIPIVVATNHLPSYVHEMLGEEQVKLVFPKPIEPRLLGAIVLGLCGIAS